MKWHYADDSVPGLADVYNSIGVVLYDLGRLDESLQHHNRALQIMKRHLGEDNFQLASTY